MSEDYTVRPAREEDLPAIAEFWRRSILSTNVTYEKEDTEADLLVKLEQHFPSKWRVDVVEIGEALVGFLALEKDEAVLAQIFIDPGYQGRGIGLDLLRRAKSAFPDGFTLWTDERNTRARAFYEREGLTLDRLVKHPVASHYRAHCRWAPSNQRDH
ncbi:MAG: N-acetyltransferase [Pseudomonadota bacterium]